MPKKLSKYILIVIIFIAAVLRFYKLGSVPPSLYWDEASLGYFGVLTVLLTYFLAKKLFVEKYHKYEKYERYEKQSLNLTSRTSGTSRTFSTSETIALLSAFFLAISPWHLQFSRVAFEANLGLFFSVLGIWLFLKFAQDNPLFIFPSLLSFLAGMYTFTGQRLFVPFILLVLAIQFRKQVFAQIKIVLKTALITSILFWAKTCFR